MTVEAWVKLSTLPSGSSVTHTIVGKYNGSSDRSYIFGIWKNGSGTLGMIVTLSVTGSVVYAFDKAYTFATDTWYHVAFVYTAASAQIEFFVNAVSQGTVTQAGCTSLFNGTADFNVGAFNNGAAEWWNGKLDEVRIWNTARTSSEISANYTRELAGTDSGLAAYYKFNNSYNDLTSNANHLSASGSPIFSTDVPFTDITTTSTTSTTTSTSTTSLSSSTSKSTSTSSSTSRTQSMTTSTSTTSTSTTSTSSSTTSTSSSTSTTSTSTTLELTFSVEVV